jgi:SAM-dependent methyltransferase
MSEDTLSSYDLWSKSYDTFANPMIAMVDQALSELPLFPKGKRVLELGCGTGRNLLLLLESEARSYTGVDGSEGMLERARALTSDPRVFWLQADLTKPLPIASGTVDLVLVTLVLEHFRELAPILGEAARALAPGGQLRILEIHSGLVENGTQAHFWHEGQEHRIDAYPHPAEEFRSVLGPTGLRIVSLEERSASERTLERMPKLSKHGGKAVLIDILAEKPLA